MLKPIHFGPDILHDPGQSLTREWLDANGIVRGENTVVVQYSVLARSSLELELTPLIAFRDYHSLAHANDALDREYVNTEDTLIFMLYEGAPAVYLSYGKADVSATGYWYRDFAYDRELERGLDYREDLFNPCQIRYTLSPSETVSLIAST